MARGAGKNKHLHITVPPYIADLIKQAAESTYRSQGQVVVDAILARYGGDIGASGDASGGG